MPVAGSRDALCATENGCLLGDQRFSMVTLSAIRSVPTTR
jgi:hypothetical protein